MNELIFDKKSSNVISTSTEKQTQSNKKNLNIQDNSNFLISKLLHVCPKFERILKQQQVNGVDEDTWFAMINLFSSCGCYGSAEKFSKLSAKHNQNSQYRLDTLKSKTYKTKGCIDLGCTYTQIFSCMGFVDENKDGISNSPAYFIERFKTFSVPKENIYKPIISKLMSSKDYVIDKKGDVYKIGKNAYKISNFIAYVTEEVVVNDGLDNDNKIKVVGILSGGKKLGEVIINSSQFMTLDWITKAWGIRPLITTGTNNKSDVREVIQILSQDSISTNMYNHTGWIKDEDGKYVYIHSNGCIGDGQVQVNLDSSLVNYDMSSNAEDIEEALLTSMKFIDIAKDSISIPLISLAFLTPLVGLIERIDKPNFILWVYGLTGSRKTSLGMMLLNYFGKFSNLPPASFKDTPNSLEVKAYMLKDNLLLIDDFHPNTDGSEAKKMDQTAERLLRMYGDRIGRSRMNSNAELQKTYIPRGMALVTGEDLPKGSSSTARFLGIEICSNDIDLDVLTELQDESQNLTKTMNQYIHYVSENINSISEYINQNFKDYRKEYSSKANHGRIADALAFLKIGFSLYLKFINEKVNDDLFSLDTLYKRCDNALIEILKHQNNLYNNQEIDELFIETLKELISVGKVYVKELDEKNNVIENENTNAGAFIGYRDEEFYYLYPMAVYSEVNKSLSSNNNRISISEKTLCSILKNKNLIKYEKNQNKPKKLIKDIQGNESRPRLIHLYKTAID